MKYNYEMHVFFSQEDGCWIARAPELQGCSAFGDTAQKALKELGIAVELWVEATRAKGWLIPAPISEKEPKGKFIVRVPKDLHKNLAMAAAGQGVSLNQYIVYKLAGSTPSHVADGPNAFFVPKKRKRTRAL